MKQTLVILTAVELVLLVAVLAGYLIAIAATLRRVSRTLGLVTFGVRAIEKQTEPVGPLLGEVNAALAQVAEAVGAPAGSARGDEQPSGQPERPELGSA